MDFNPYLSISEVQAGLKNKDFSCAELTQAFLDRSKKLEHLNSYVTLDEEGAMKQAKAVDARLASGEALRALEGVPTGVKELFNTKGVRSTSSSRMLENFVPPYESRATQALKDAGYVMLGKLNCDEFACGASNETSYFGPVLNPWNTEYVPGGSSGGSVASVAAGQCVFSMGTDTGGSIRQPASLTGVVGLKPTYGRISRFGVTAMASSWDVVGPLTRNVEDAARVLQVMAGKDPYDATTPDVEVPDYSANLSKGVEGLTIGVPKEYFIDGVDPEVRELVMAAIKEYEKMGATVKEVSLPMTKYGVAVYYVTMPGELSTNLARFDGVRFGHKAEGDFADIHEYYKASRGEGFGDEIKRRIMVGTFVLSAGYADAYYKQALKARTLIIQDFAQAFEDVDVLMAPTYPTPAFKLGEKASDPLAMYLADALTIPASAAGVPGISIPCGFTGAGLPVGLQIIAPQFEESRLLQVAAAYEQATNWHTMRPQL